MFLSLLLFTGILGVGPTTVASADSGSSSVSESALPDGLYAKITTPHGVFIARLFNHDAPLTVTNFVGLAEGTLGTESGKPFYNGLTFHRVVPGFVIQGGDPLGTGEGDPGYEFPDEFSPKLRHDSIGVVSMANSGPDTNGCQFFITLDAQNQLNYLHSVFGKVVFGLDVLPQVRAGDKMDVKILRIGSEAGAFKADKAAFEKLIAKVPPATFPHFSDEDQILPLKPPREKGFNNKLFNFERFTGVKIYVRAFATFHATALTPTSSEAVRVIAQQLGVNQTGITALYFGDTQHWEILVGDQLKKSGDADGLQAWKQSIESRAAEAGVKMIAVAEKNASKDEPLTEAQRHYFRVAMMLEELVETFGPK
ncbi:MAG: peptidylprolyl isomerase [Verrucomicrobia bacterium]|nr:peptidylprolyl isomerase [Verrucomicrobiota bacterium]